MEAEVRKRPSSEKDKTDGGVPAPTLAGTTTEPPAAEQHPSGRKQYGQTIQILRALSFGIFFTSCCVA